MFTSTETETGKIVPINLTTSPQRLSALLGNSVPNTFSLIIGAFKADGTDRGPIYVSTDGVTFMKVVGVYYVPVRGQREWYFKVDTDCVGIATVMA